MQLFAHDRVVAALERHLAEAKGDARIPLLVELAWHLRQRDTHRALALADEAGRRAKGATDDARVTLMRAEWASLQARYDEAERLFARALAAFRRHGDLVGEGDTHALEGIFAVAAGDGVRGRASLEAAMGCHHRAGDAERLSEIHELLCLSLHERPVLADVVPPEPSTPMALAFHRQQEQSAVFLKGDYLLAEQMSLDAVETFIAHGGLRHAIDALLAASAAAGNSNALERASEHAARAYALAEPLGWPLVTGRCLHVLGGVAGLMGQKEQAITFYRDALEWVSLAPHSRDAAALVTRFGTELLDLGRVEEALALIERFRDPGANWPDDIKVSLKATEAAVLSLLDRPIEALPLALDAYEIADRAGDFGGVHVGGRTLADIHLRHRLPAPDGMTAPSPALHYLGLLLARYEAAGTPLPFEIVNRLSRAWEAAGDLAKALDYERQARRMADSESAQRTEDRYLAMRATHAAEKARIEADHHRQRTGILQEAGETLERLGAIGQEIIVKRDAGAVFETIHRHATRLMDIRSILIFLLSADGSLLRCEHGMDDAAAVPAMAIALNDRLSDVATAARERREILVEGDAAEEMPSMLYAPLLQGEELFGVMTVESRRPQAYGERERAIFRTLCAYGAIAFGNAAARRTLSEANDRADEAARAKSAFLANMSHEIRTPMNAVLGLSHLALKSDPSPRQADYLTKIQQSGQHLLGIINDILDFSKIEAGKLTIETIEFDLDEVLDNISNLMAEKAAAKGLELVFDIDPVLPARLIGDPLRLGQILINFCDNAIKFTDSGEIVVTARAREETARDQVLYFAATDTGIGLSEAQKGMLFRAFQQADTSTTRKYGGTGLGLTISKSLAESMGGTIGVESELGKGSTFWFTARLGKTGAEHPRQLVPDLRGRRVLVVDDGLHARAVMADMLIAMEFEVHEAPSGFDGLDMVRSAVEAGRPYDIAFLDWLMPGIDGIETGRRIRAASTLPHLVMVTAHGREEVMRQAEGAGFANVLVKPLKPSMLYDAVVRLLGHASAKPGAVPAAAVPDLATVKGARILIVEDNEINQEVAIGLLEPMEARCDIAPNGADAVRMIREVSYDLVLMDMQMPVMDGLEATRLIRADPRYHGLPIVAMTANAMEGDRRRCLEAGMNDHIGKPIDPEVLFAALLRWIAPRTGETEAVVERPAAPPDAAAAVPAMAIPGIDVATGLQRIGGNALRYATLLRKFAEREAGTVEVAQRALAGGDIATAERLLHTLKGTAGTLGAAALSASARAAEATVKSGSRDPAILDGLARHMAETVAAIRGALPVEAVAENSPPRSGLDDAARAALDRLGTLLAASDGEAVDFLQDSAPALAGLLTRVERETLVDAVDEFDFDKALKALDDIRRRLGIGEGTQSLSVASLSS